MYWRLKILIICFCCWSTHGFAAAESELSPPSGLSYPSVEPLYLDWARREEVWDVDQDHWKTVLNFCNVTALDLSDSRTDQSIVPLANALTSSPVTILHLNNDHITEEDLRILIAGLVGSRIEELELEGNAFGFRADSAANLASTMIRILNLANNEIDIKEFMPFLAEAQCLLELDLSGNPIDMEGVVAIALALQHRESVLSVLILNNCGIDNKTCREIANGLRGSKLSSLSMANNEIGAKGLKALGRAFDLAKLNKLELSGNKITATALPAFVESVRSSTLRTVDFAGNEIGDAGLGAIVDALPEWNLRSLAVSGPNLGYNSLRQLAYKLKGSSLTELRLLSLGKKEGKGLTQVMKFLAQSKLHSFRIYDSALTDAQAVSLADSLVGNEKLRNLTLKNVGLSDGAAVAIVNAVERSRLFTLNLTGNKISPDAGRDFLGPLSRSNLRGFSIDFEPEDIGLNSEIRQTLEAVKRRKKRGVGAGI